MPKALPFIPSNPNYEMSVTLADVDYVFDVKWNQREGAWYLAAFTVDGEPIFRSRKIVLGALIGGRVAADNRLPGALIASDLSGSDVDAGLDDLGDRVRVYFYTLEEIEGL